MEDKENLTIAIEALKKIAENTTECDAELWNATVEYDDCIDRLIFDRNEARKALRIINKKLAITSMS